MKRKLTILKEEVASRAEQLKEDVEAIRALLRDKYWFGDTADEFNIVEEAVKGYKESGRLGSFNSTQDKIKLTVTLPKLSGTITDGVVYVTVSNNDYFMVGVDNSGYKASAVSPNGHISKCVERCKKFFDDIRAINPKYVGE